MFVILGASGNVGSQVVKVLSKAEQPVLAVVHSAEKAAGMRARNVEPVVADVTDNVGLRAVFRRGRRAFLLNPPCDPSGDSNGQELATAKSITDALVDSGLEKIVVASTYGARPGDSVGDLSTLFEFERAALASGIPMAVNRGAYYFTNLDMLLEPAREGILPTAFPADLELPMVAAIDLGEAAADRLQSPLYDLGVAHVEGPKRYTFEEVAAAFARHLHRDVTPATTPREKWEESFRSVGFSEAAARSFARMTAATIDEPELPPSPRRGRVALDAYVATLATS
ncbi:MAG: NAD(P)H-binding protein [Devosia sp.]